jgi:hypothetical protein
MSQIYFFAIQNKKKRFFIPSKECSFGGVTVPLLMIDSGCNSLLLPTPDISELITKFPQTDYIWNVTTSKTVGGNGVTLNITKKIGKISSCIKNDQFNYQFESELLRFHLDAVSINNLLSQNLIPPLDLGDLSHLKPRHHGLIGQSVLSDKLSLQYKGIFFLFEITNPNDLLEIWNQLMTIKSNESSYITKHFDIKEFHDLEDEDHDEEHYGEEMIVDYYDE